MLKKKKKAEPEQQSGRFRAPLLALLIVAATVGAFVALSGDDKQPQQQKAVDEGAVIEIAPVLPTNRMVDASWHSEEQREANPEPDDESNSNSMLDGVKWGDGDDRRVYEKSIEKTMDNLHGLGVYVAPFEDANESDKKKKRK